jgi:hypothetical protein
VSFWLDRDEVPEKTAEGAFSYRSSPLESSPEWRTVSFLGADLGMRTQIRKLRALEKDQRHC